MKVSFSRKGFDSSYGGQPNAILPDGTLLVFPIPDQKEGKDLFGNLVFKGKPIIEYITELKPRTKHSHLTPCHLDPDLCKELKGRPENWIPAFGQSNQSLSELRNNAFGIGDLFLFFGWFKETEIIKGELKYKKGAPDINLIYGYLQVGKILENGASIPAGLFDHPHAEKLIDNSNRDAIYLPTDYLSFHPSLPGASMLKYSPLQVLTAPNLTRSKWKLPRFFDDIRIGHSPKQPNLKEYYQSAPIGQEMIWDAGKIDNSEVYNWLREICENIE